MRESQAGQHVMEVAEMLATLAGLGLVRDVGGWAVGAGVEGSTVLTDLSRAYTCRMATLLPMLPSALDAIVRWLGEQPEVERVVLFGSRARRDGGPRSDIDLAIEAPGATRRQWLDWEGMIEDSATLLRIDVVRWDEASPELRNRIAHEGLVLHDRSQAQGQPAQPGQRAPAPA